MSRKRHGAFHAGLRLLRTDLPQGPAQDFPLLPADDCRVRIAGRIGLRQCVFWKLLPHHEAPAYQVGVCRPVKLGKFIRTAISIGEALRSERTMARRSHTSPFAGKQESA